MSAEERRRAILEEAAKDKELARNVPAVVAAGFGVLPLRRLGDVLTVACLPRASRRALRALRDVLQLEIVATPFDDQGLHEAIRTAYFAGDPAMNFPTFTSPEFLEDPDAVAALREEKVERPEASALLLPPDQVALVTLGYASTLQNLDAPTTPALPDPRRTRLTLGPLEPAWTRDARGRVRPGLPLAPETRLLLTEFRASEHRQPLGGRSGEHDVRALALAALPHVIHPTEVQLVRLEADGAIGIHAYDRLVRVRPGHTARVELVYYFLSYGNRLRRAIVLDVLDVVTMPRSELSPPERHAPWGPAELARWLGVAPAPAQEV